jgi:hypothetical protein
MYRPASIRRAPLRRALAVAVLATATLGVLAVPGHAAKGPNPCKVLKTSDISKAFGGATVDAGKAGMSTAVSSECSFEVAASGALPAGTVTVHIMSPRGKVAFKAHEKGTYGFQPVAGQKGVLYWDKTGSAEMLKGDTLVGVQGVFLGDSLPITQSDVEAQVVSLVKVARKRV